MDKKQLKKQRKELKGEIISHRKLFSLWKQGLIVKYEIVPELQKPSTMGNCRLTVTDINSKRYTVKVFYNRNTNKFEQPYRQEYSSNNDGSSAAFMLMGMSKIGRAHV